MASTSNAVKCLFTMQMRKACLCACFVTGPLLVHTPVRNMPNSKHYDPKWRKHRARKYLKVDLPDFHKQDKESDLSPDEMRLRMKKEGRLPPRVFEERPLNISNTGSIFEPFVPPEGDGRKSSVTKEGLKERFSELGMKGESLKHMRRLKKYEEGFSSKEFSLQAQEMVIEAHRLLQDVEVNQERLHDLVTEKAFPEMVHGLERRSLRWTFVQSLEPPHMVHVRVTDMLSKNNLYAQITMRFHTQQIFALYDQFGRLMFGDAKHPKDVLEYVVFEKHIVNEYGLWRIHGKIHPDWMPPRGTLRRTYVQPTFDPLPPMDGKDQHEGSSDERKGGEGDVRHEDNIAVT